MSLTAAARPYIDASVPVLREHGVAITTHFYAEMFKAHPELTNLFNMGNQANGTQQQSLAAAVFAYAANIDNAAALTPVIERIVHKHVSIGIKPAHYTLVGRYLLGAIKQVLGNAATPDLMAAWDEAYWLLAGELIAAESRLHQRAGTYPGQLFSVTVAAVRTESEQIKSLYLTTPDGRSPGPFKPGQYLSVAVQLGDLRQLRQYSLSDSPHQPWWRISVKREEAGNHTPEGQVSNWLHAHVKVGDELLVSAAFGDFAPQLLADHTITLISAGVGITPMISVLNTLTATNPGRPVTFIHAARHGGHHALQADLATAREMHPALRQVVFYENPRLEDRPGEDFNFAGRADVGAIINEREQAGEFFICGPIGFMQQQWKALLLAGVPPSRIHREVFGPELLDHLIQAAQP